MAATNFGTVHRASSFQSSAALIRDNESINTTQKNPAEFKIVWPFTIPPTSEAAAERMIKNIVSLRLYYFEFLFIVLFITLIPKRKVSLILLVAMKEIAILYLLLLRSLPILHNFIDTRVAFFLLAVITAILLAVTDAAIHLVATVGSVTPIILVHAVLWRREEVVVAGGDDRGVYGLVTQDHRGGADVSTGLV